jgi:hypothetical protein
MKLVPVSAALLAASLTTLVATASPALPVSAPPVAHTVASDAVWEALQAVARAAGSAPAAARQSMPAYEAAVQQYNAGDFSAAQASALTVLQETAAYPLPQPSLYPLLIPAPPFYNIANPINSDQAYATANLATARLAMTQCGAPDAIPAQAIQQQFAQAVNDLVALDFNGTNTVSAALVTACGTATQAYAMAQAALPQPPSTPIPMESYSPVPLATLIPDPALRQAAQ